MLDVMLSVCFYAATLYGSRVSRMSLRLALDQVLVNTLDHNRSHLPFWYRFLPLEKWKTYIVALRE